MDWLSLFLLFLLLLVSLPYLQRTCRSWINYIVYLDEFPGPKPYPIIGSTLEYLVTREGLADVFKERFKKYGAVCRVWNLTYLQADLFISKPEFIEVILNNTKHIKKSTSYDRLNSWLGTGLLTSTGRKWQLHRKLLTPTFHFKILEEFFEVFVEKSNTLVAKMKKLPDNTVVDLMPLISNCTLDIICETAMGTRLNIQEDDLYKHYVTTVYELSELATYREFRPWLYSSFIFNLTPQGKRYKECLSVLHGFTKKVIQERKLQRLNLSHGREENQSNNIAMGSKKRLAFLDLLLDTCDSDHPLTDSEVREEVDTFMFRGHDTTAMAITWTLYVLGRHPHIQRAVIEELEQIFSGSLRMPTLEDLQDMKYFERVIKESLRLYPSVPFIARRIEEDLPVGEGYIIPAGTNVTIDIVHTHRDPDQFQDPDTFNPDNFLPEYTRLRHPYAYIPFSGGPRNCIGQKFAVIEDKIVLSSILRNFSIEAVEENPPVLQELTLKPFHGLLVKLSPRKHKL